MKGPIETAVHTHLDCWNAGDRERWITAFDVEITKGFPSVRDRPLCHLSYGYCLKSL